MNTKLIAGAVIALVVIGGSIFFAKQKSTTPETQTVESKIENTKLNMAQKEVETTSNEKEKMMVGENKTAEKKTEGQMKENETNITIPGEYLDYSSSTMAAELSEGHKVVLFFHAAWCPTCKAADAAFRANLDQIPTNVVVLKTDYDSNAELKKKYGVTYQHTFVQIDKNGDQITKWISGDISALKTNVK